MEFQWEKKNKDQGVSDKEVLNNPRAYHSYVVEGAIARTLLEMSALHHKLHQMVGIYEEEVKKFRAELKSLKK